MGTDSSGVLDAQRFSPGVERRSGYHSDIVHALKPEDYGLHISLASWLNPFRAANGPLPGRFDSRLPNGWFPMHHIEDLINT
jgi:hypothetical protein